jgi:hypothetical protein
MKPGALAMSAIPPNLAGPILQTPLTQRQASATRSGDEAQRAASERRQTGAITEADSTVETTDNDTQVFTDAEGSGSQGRAFSQPDPKEQPPDEASLDGSQIDLQA